MLSHEMTVLMYSISSLLIHQIGDSQTVERLLDRVDFQIFCIQKMYRLDFGSEKYQTRRDLYSVFLESNQRAYFA